MRSRRFPKAAVRSSLAARRHCRYPQTYIHGEYSAAAEIFFCRSFYRIAYGKEGEPLAALIEKGFGYPGEGALMKIAADNDQEVSEALAETELDPRRLEIEVTESALLTNPTLALKIFKDLKALGVRVSLDDFGAGFSSLSYFRMFPFDKVKIDQSFVADISGHASREIIRSVIALSRNLGIVVVAEGVEQPAQLEALRKMGCPQIQGFLVGRPKPTEYYQRSLVIGRRHVTARAA